MQQPITICQVIKMSFTYSKIRDFFQTGKFTHRRPTFDTAEKATMLIYLETQYVHIIKSIITEQIPPSPFESCVHPQNSPPLV